MHVPNWGNQTKASFQPSPVFDDKFFWIKVEHRDRDDSDQDPMAPLPGFCDQCSLCILLDRDECPEIKGCPNCSANYTLRSFSNISEAEDVRRKIYFAQRAKSMYEKDEDWLSYDANSNLI